jgi:2-polyprenyl-3-methyl-5-hydroxy-6-metoxy-1,4-benzoquinol methylase
MIVVKKGISERYLIPFSLNIYEFKSENQDIMGDDSKNFNYSVIDIFATKATNYYWYFVDKFSCKLDKLAEKYIKIISEAYRKESKEFGITDAENVLHIGCGAFPVSAMTLAEENGRKIIGIDSNPKVIAPAINVIKKRNLENKIKIEYGNGTNYSIDNFDMIVISACAVPKKRVVEHIFQTAKPGTKIIVRELYSKKNVMDKMINSYDDIKIIKRIDNNPFITSKWESLYLEKK